MWERVERWGGEKRDGGKRRENEEKGRGKNIRKELRKGEREELRKEKRKKIVTNNSTAYFTNGKHGFCRNYYRRLPEIHPPPSPFCTLLCGKSVKGHLLEYLICPVHLPLPPFLTIKYVQ